MLATIDLITAISTKINRHLSLHTAHMLLSSLKYHFLSPVLMVLLDSYCIVHWQADYIFLDPL